MKTVRCTVSLSHSVVEGPLVERHLVLKRKDFHSWSSKIICVQVAGPQLEASPQSAATTLLHAL